MKIQELVDLHLNQEYGEFNDRIPYQRILDQYERFPNEAVYIIDCQKAEILPLSNQFSKIIGIDYLRNNELNPLYEHVDHLEFETFMKFTKRLVSVGFNAGLNHIPEKDVFSCVYKGTNGKTILKSTAVLFKDTHEKMRYSIGKLIDVSGLMAYKGFSYRFDGSNQDYVYGALNDVKDLSPHLTARELEILTLISKGYSSKQIATTLNISKLTVDTHRKNIINKLEASSSVEAYKKAQDAGLFS